MHPRVPRTTSPQSLSTRRAPALPLVWPGHGRRRWLLGAQVSWSHGLSRPRKISRPPVPFLGTRRLRKFHLSNYAVCRNSLHAGAYTNISSLQYIYIYIYIYNAKFPQERLEIPDAPEPNYLTHLISRLGQDHIIRKDLRYIPPLSLKASQTLCKGHPKRVASDAPASTINNVI